MVTRRTSRTRHRAAGNKWLLTAVALVVVMPNGGAATRDSSRAGGCPAEEALEGLCLRWPSGHGLNDGRLLGGAFAIGGVPVNFEAGKSYAMTVMIAHPGKTSWAFELSARFADSGKQAGSWIPVDTSTVVRSEAGFQYAAEAPSRPSEEVKDGPAQFRIDWVAPGAQDGPIIFSATGKAAGGDDAAGDFVYSAGGFSRPAESQQSPVPKPASSDPQQPSPEPVEVSPEATPGFRRLQEMSRIANLPAPVNLKRGSMEILIQHRFLESIGSAGAGNAFGIDSGANIDLGVNFGLTDRLSVGVARTRFDQIVDLSGTFEIRTSDESRWRMSLVGGVEGKRNFHEVYSPYLQLAGSMDFGRLRVSAVPTVAFNTRPEERLEFDLPGAINPDSNSTFSLGLGSDLALSRRLSLTAEYVPRLAGFGGFDERRDHVAGGLVIRTWGHVFTILVGRSRDFTPSKYAVNAEESEVSLGFNIYRRIR